MYFVVVPEGFGDEEPDVQWDNANLNDTQFVDDTITLTGKVLSRDQRPAKCTLKRRSSLTTSALLLPSSTNSGPAGSLGQERQPERR